MRLEIIATHRAENENAIRLRQYSNQMSLQRARQMAQCVLGLLIGLCLCAWQLVNVACSYGLVLIS